MTNSSAKSQQCDACGKHVGANEEMIELADKKVCPKCIFDFDKHMGILNKQENPGGKNE